MSSNKFAMPDKPTVWIRVSQAANLLGVSVGTVYTLLRKRMLSGIVVMGAKRVDLASVDAFIAANKTGPGEPGPEVKEEVKEVKSLPQSRRRRGRPSLQE